MAIVYTTAPEAYDGFSTKTVEAHVGTNERGHVIRKVEMDSVDYDWQTMRYHSGLYGTFGEFEAENLFEAGIWTREVK